MSPPLQPEEDVQLTDEEFSQMYERMIAEKKE